MRLRWASASSRVSFCFLRVRSRMRRGRTFKSRAESDANAYSVAFTGDHECCATGCDCWLGGGTAIQRNGEQHDEYECDLEREWNNWRKSCARDDQRGGALHGATNFAEPGGGDDWRGERGG